MSETLLLFSCCRHMLSTLDYNFLFFKKKKKRYASYCDALDLEHTCQLSQFSRESPSFKSNLPVRAPNLPDKMDF